MMKHSKRFLCLLLTLILAASLCVFPAAAADQTCPSSKDDPVVFVHGLMGWGQRAGINAVLPYWGMTTGSLTSYLNSLGYETYSATVGPISSAWDRACELYAQLTGTTVDYGAAHAAAYDHAVSHACPVASTSTAAITGTPRPATYSRRTVWPGPFGATSTTSTPSGASM